MARDSIEAPPATPPKYSLLIAAPTIADTTRWQDGFQFAPEGCGSSGRVEVDCTGSTDELDPAANPGVAVGDPFGVWAADECSTFGWAARAYVDRAIRQLAATESFQIASELWGGSLNGPDVENLSLTDPSSDTVTAAAASPSAALAAVVEALGACGQGRQGMVHVTPQVLVHLAADQAIYREGGLWYAPMGHLVVADDGYDGAGPGDVPATSSQWMYGTSMMRIRLSQVFVTPAPPADPNAIDWSAAVNRATNLVTVFAQRLAAIQWDRCCHVAAQVNVAVALTGGAS